MNSSRREMAGLLFTERAAAYKKEAMPEVGFAVYRIFRATGLPVLFSSPV